MSVLIGMPCYGGTVPVAMLQSLLMLRKPCPTGFVSVERQRIDKARNYMAMECLQGRLLAPADGGRRQSDPARDA